VSARTLRGLTDDLAKLGNGGMRKIIKKVLVAGALSAEARAKKNVTGSIGGISARTGRLRASIAAGVREKPGSADLFLRAGGNSKGGAQVRYARIHEYGGTVTPKKGKFLTIPVGPALTAAGVSRYATARDVPDLVFAQTLRGQFVLGKNKGKRGGTKGKEGFEVWYLLRTSVTIPKRPYLLPALEDEAELVAKALDTRVTSSVMGKAI